MSFDPATPERFEPPGQDDVEAGARVAYLLRRPRLYDEAELRERLLAQGAPFVGHHHILSAARDGVEFLLSDPADEALRLRYVGVLDAHRDLLTTDPIAALTAPNPEVGRIIVIVRQGYAPLWAAEAAAERYWSRHGTEAARLFVVGRENPAGGGGEELERDGRGLTDAALMSIPPGHRLLIGGAVERLFRPTEDEEKNSDSPPPGRSAPRRSPAARKPASNGPLPAIAGDLIP